jgi:RimJ/RimL family protein N-acetyltransferase
MAVETAARHEALALLCPDTLTVWDKPEICLRVPEVDDAEDLYEVMLMNQQHMEVFQPLRMNGATMADLAISIDASRMLMSRGAALNYHIVKGESIVGGVAIRSIGNAVKTPRLAYWVSQEAEGRGYAYSASRRLVQFAFEDMGVDTVALTIDPRNTRSEQVASRLEAFLTGEVETLQSEDGQTVATYRIWEIEKQ